MALKDMKSDLAIGVGSKQTPQSFVDGHSSTIVQETKSLLHHQDFKLKKVNLLL